MTGDALGTPVALLLGKVTVVLVLAWGVAACLRSSAKDTSDLAWLTALVVCALLPVLSPSLPELDVSVPEATAYFTASARPVNASSGPPESTSRDAISGMASGRSEGAESSSGPAQILTWLGAGTWSAGAALFLLLIARERWRLARLRRSSSRARDPRILEMAAEAGRSLGFPSVVRTVEVRITGAVSLPLTWGTLRPTIVLPEAAASWPDRRLRAVFIHELAHVRRRDHLRRQVATAAWALYWFHPLARVAVRRIRAAGETACDAAVVRAGVEPADYAEELIALARTSRSRGTWLAPAVGRCRADLEHRVRSLLRTDVGRSVAPGPVPGIAAFCGGILAALVLVVEPAPFPGAPRPGTSTQAESLVNAPVSPRLPAFAERASEPSAPSPSDTSECWRPDRTRDRNSNKNEEHGIWSFAWTSPSCESSMRVVGTVWVTSDLGRIVRLDPASSLRIVERDRGVERRLSVRSGEGGRPRVELQVDGRPVEAYDPGQRSWLRGRVALLQAETDGVAVRSVH